MDGEGTPAYPDTTPTCIRAQPSQQHSETSLPVLVLCFDLVYPGPVPHYTTLRYTSVHFVPCCCVRSLSCSRTSQRQIATICVVDTFSAGAQEFVVSLVTVITFDLPARPPAPAVPCRCSGCSSRTGPDLTAPIHVDTREDTSTQLLC